MITSQQFLSFFKITFGHIFLNCSYCLLVTAEVALIAWIVGNFILNKILIILFNNVPDTIYLFNLDWFGVPTLCGWFLFDTSFKISCNCLKQRKSYEKEEKRKKGQRNCLYVFGKIVCFLLEQIPALNHSFGCIFQNCPSSFFIFFYLVFLQKWGKNLAIVLSKSHWENWMRLSDALMRGWRLMLKSIRHVLLRANDIQWSS